MKNDEQSLSTQTDEELMAAYKMGNAVAFQTLYERHRTKVYGYLSRQLVNKTDVNDVFQECFLRIHKFRAKYDATFPFVPWLFTVCRNSLIDHLRQKARRKEESAGAAENIADTSVAEATELEESLRGLSAQENAILGLHYLQGYSFSEVAQHLRIQPASARKISSRAIQKLKGLLK